MLENTLIVCAVVVVSVIVGGALGYAKGLCDAEAQTADEGVAAEAGASAAGSVVAHAASHHPRDPHMGQVIRCRLHV